MLCRVALWTQIAEQRINSEVQIKVLIEPMNSATRHNILMYSCIALAVNSTPVNKKTWYILTWVKHSTKWIKPSYLGGSTKTALLPNFTTGFVHIFRDASNRLQYSELLPENCRLHPGYHKGPYQDRYCFCCLWTIYQTLLKHRELPVTPMISRRWYQENRFHHRL